jgi:hypothetical protein
MQNSERQKSREAARKSGEAEAQKFIDANKASEKRIIRWLARLGFIPMFLASASNVAVVTYWLFDGKVKEISRYGSRMMLSSEQPVEFWVSIAYHSALALFLCLTTALCFRATDWVKTTRDP